MTKPRNVSHKKKIESSRGSLSYKEKKSSQEKQKKSHEPSSSSQKKELAPSVRCKECNKEFNSARALQQHTSSKHKVKLPRRSNDSKVKRLHEPKQKSPANTRNKAKDAKRNIQTAVQLVFGTPELLLHFMRFLSWNTLSKIAAVDKTWKAVSESNDLWLPLLKPTFSLSFKIKHTSAKSIFRLLYKLQRPRPSDSKALLLFEEFITSQATQLAAESDKLFMRYIYDKFEDTLEIETLPSTFIEKKPIVEKVMKCNAFNVPQKTLLADIMKAILAYRGFGEFYCKKCRRTWHSGFAYFREKQQCHQCRGWYVPSTLTQLSQTDHVSKETHDTAGCTACKKGFCDYIRRTSRSNVH